MRISFREKAMRDFQQIYMAVEIRQDTVADIWVASMRGHLIDRFHFFKSFVPIA